MWVHSLPADLVTLGPLHIRFYGLVYVAGFLLAYYWMRAAARAGRIQNMTDAIAESFILWAMIGLVVGARLYHVIVDYALYAGRPLDMLKIWQGGLAFHGGILGLVVVSYVFARRHKLRFYDLADVLVIPAALALGLGRLANFVNGELWGRPTDVTWCVVFPDANDGLCRHPSQLYEAAKNFVIFGALVALNAGKVVVQKVRPPGFLFWVFVTLYGWLRFAVTHFRDDAGWAGTPWPLARWLALGMGIAGIAVLALHFRGAFSVVRPQAARASRPKSMRRQQKL